MQGFITESLSKLTDGIGSAIQLVAVMALVSLLLIPVTQSLDPAVNLVLLLLLLVGGFYLLYRSLLPDQPAVKRATNGMLSGLLLWQVLNHSGLAQRWGMTAPNGYLLWLSAALVILLLWRKLLPVGLRFILLLVLLNWLGSLYMQSLALAPGYPDYVVMLLTVIRYTGVLGIAASLWFIIRKSKDAVQRKYASTALYFSVLLAFLLF